MTLVTHKAINLLFIYYIYVYIIIQSEILNPLCPLGQRVHELSENAYKTVCVHLHVYAYMWVYTHPWGERSLAFICFPQSSATQKEVNNSRSQFLLVQYTTSLSSAQLQAD